MFSLPAFLSRFFPHPLSGRLTKCDLCGADRSKIIATRDRFGAPLTNVLCLDCGLIYTNPMPTEEALRAYYAKDYRLHYQGARDPRAKHLARGMLRAQERLAMLTSYLPAGASLLDIGAGAGEFVAAATAHGFVARGVEPSADFAAFARRHFRVDVREGGWQTLVPETERFAFISLHHVLEHLATPRAALLHMRDMLSEDGLLYVSVPDVLDRARSPHGRWHVGHVHGFCGGTLDALATATGFRPVGGVGTTRLYRKTALPEAWRPDGGLADEVAAALAAHTALRHYTSATPYARFIERGWRHAGQTLAVRPQRAVDPSRSRRLRTEPIGWHGDLGEEQFRSDAADQVRATGPEKSLSRVN